jgi:hypothetical protein
MFLLPLSWACYAVRTAILNFYKQWFSLWLEVLTAVTMKMAASWVIAPCRLVWVYRRFRGLYCLHHRGDESTLRYSPEDCHLQWFSLFVQLNVMHLQVTNLFTLKMVLNYHSCPFWRAKIVQKICTNVVLNFEENALHHHYKYMDNN